MIKTFVKKTRKGRVIRVVREHYLRGDVRCGSDLCRSCPPPSEDSRQSLGVASTYIVPDTNVVLHYPDLLEHAGLSHVVVLQVVLDETRNRSPHIHNRLRAVISDAARHFFVFLNEHHKDTYVTQLAGESPNDRNDRAIRVAASWYGGHLSQSHAAPEVVLLSDDAACLKKAQEEGITAMRVEQYVRERLGDTHPELLDIVARPTELAGPSDGAFRPYIPMAEANAGVRAGTLLQGVYHGSRDRRRGTVAVSSDGGGSSEVVVEGVGVNRAVHGDVVVVRVTPDAPEEDTGDDVDQAEDAVVVPSTVDEDAAPPPDVKGEVVAIARRMWRPYVGTVDIPADAPATTASQNLLVMPMDKRIPKIRIRTRQSDALRGMRIVVQLDDWAVSSRYPNGHYVRTLGRAGDKAVETAALLLEHEIPTHEFSESVLACLPAHNPPDSPWSADAEMQRETEGTPAVSVSESGVVVELVDRKGDAVAVTGTGTACDRRDLRALDVFSVDPVGCTDIDDALHVSRLPNGLIEIGVHIADVSYFVRPGTALDGEAARRATTVYLVDQRVEMLPSLLSTHVCSLRGGEDRFAFSVIWTVDDDAVVKAPTWFGKSVIRSRRAFSYEEAQALMDDSDATGKIVTDMRLMNTLAKALHARRVAAGTLVLASPEVKFRLEEGGENPVDCTAYQLHEANAMVEEFMLLANVAVAERIHEAFPHCAVLRRHPEPRDGPLAALAAAAKRILGVDLDTTSSLTLGQSLDRAGVALMGTRPYMDRLLRIMTTRCMSRARYFSSGSVTETEYRHYGLAVPIYTHFTSPIRRYADLVVHRLLGAAIGLRLESGAVATNVRDNGPTLSLVLPTRHDVQAVTDTINQRAYAAQLSGRASVELHSVLFFSGRTIEVPAHVTRIRDDGVVVLVAEFGVEATIKVDGDGLTWAVEEDGCALVGRDAGAVVAAHRLFDELSVVIETVSDASGASRVQVSVAPPKRKRSRKE